MEKYRFKNLAWVHSELFKTMSNISDDNDSHVTSKYHKDPHRNLIWTRPSMREKNRPGTYFTNGNGLYQVQDERMVKKLHRY